MARTMKSKNNEKSTEKVESFGINIFDSENLYMKSGNLI
jgi:hypothetical protein